MGDWLLLELIVYGEKRGLGERNQAVQDNLRGVGDHTCTYVVRVDTVSQGQTSKSRHQKAAKMLMGIGQCTFSSTKPKFLKEANLFIKKVFCQVLLCAT